MSAPPSSTGASVPPAPVRDQSLRVRGAVILVLVVVEIFIGNELAVAGSPYPDGWLAAHVVVGLLLLGVAGHAARISMRLPKASVRVAAVVTVLAVLGAFASGLAFLFAGETNAALYGMEGFAVVALLGSLLLLVLGGVTVRPPTTAQPA